MITLEIGGFGRLALDHLVLDYNGTIARDGSLLPEAAELNAAAWATAATTC